MEESTQLPPSVVGATFVRVWSKDTKNSYSNGEYVILAVGPARKSIIACKPQAGYAGYDRKTFHTSEWDIVENYSDDAAVLKFITEQEHFSKALDRGEKPQWIESVYSGAGDNARMLRRSLEQKTGQKYESLPATATVHIPCHECKNTNELLKKLCAHLGVKLT